MSVTDDIDNEFRSFTRLELEERALIDPPGMDRGRGVATAEAEIVWRDREYAQEQERSRREFERELERMRTEREQDRQRFEASLAADNRAAAKEAALIQATATREVADKQLRSSQAVARATIAAAIAAFLSFADTAFPIIKAAWFPQTTAAQAPSSGAAPTTHQ